MPASNDRTRPHRKVYYSCNFCRSRKIRCDRPLPCTNCKSRGKRCLFGSEDVEQQQPEHLQQQASHPPPTAATADQGGLLVEIRNLRKLAEDLERRVTDQTTTATPPLLHNSNGTNFVLPESPSSLTSLRDTGVPVPSGCGSVSEELVAHLERVSMGQGSYESIDGDDLVFRVDHIRAIPLIRSHIVQPGRPSRCVLLPRHDEARVILEKFITNVSYIHHVVHHPSLAGVIDELYRQITCQEPVKLGYVVLLLSIVASVTHVWGLHDDVGHEGSLFSSSAQANAQTAVWIEVTYDMLNRRNGPPVTQEALQGIIILSFLLCNLEGVSLRYRSLISTGLLLGREMGLHRTDHESNVIVPNTISVEIGRRVWWYLATTDWLLAARYGRLGEGVYQTNPRHMTVKKPRNISDIDLVDGGINPDLPVSQLTDMSYFLQRIRLAEISRGIVDQATTGHIYIISMNAQLDQMIQEIPSFFRLDNYEHNPESTSSNTFIQAYMLNSIIHTQRCKLHLSYLTSKFINDPTHASWREKCLQSARQIIRAEAQLEKSQHPFVLIRQRLSGILYGVFMAGIVLLMDACANGPNLHLGGARRGEAAEALRIIDAARGQSLAAANLHNLLMQILAKYRAQKQHEGLFVPGQPPPQLEVAGVPPVAPSTPAMGPIMTPIPERRLEPLSHEVNSSQAAARGADGGVVTGGPVIITPDRLDITDGQLEEGLGGLMDLDDFPWDDLLSGMDSTSFAF
ncbi:hypothetical protein FQN49_000273 [Arthroderma sp. PD_2]|nr:hypothetical protein FQN49_000273 [Arthroderma sp. PD_2]